MAEKSGFFNARMVGGEYDRKYNANDYCDNLAVIISSGVLRSADDDLKVTASGMTLTVKKGRAWIKGHYYYNDSNTTLTVPSAPSGGARYDRVVLRMNRDITVRSISLVYLTGTAGNDPVKPAITRNDDVYDLVIADIYVAAQAVNASVIDTRSDNSVCGWVYSTSGDGSFFTSLDNSFNEWFEGARDTLASVTLFHRYSWEATLGASTNRIVFNIPQWDSDTCFLEVYVNGILSTDWTYSIGSQITFPRNLTAGTKITVYCFKSIDGTGINSIVDELDEVQIAVEALSGVANYTYKCTGLNDNISLSQIAQAIYNGSYVESDVTEAAAAFLNALGGNTYLAALTTEAQITINVVGRCGVSTAAYGQGTSVSRYRYFNFGVAGVNAKKIIFDFSDCEKITVGCAANTANIIFYGTDLYLKGANVYAYSNGASCQIQMIAGNNNGNIDIDNCRFSVSCSGDALIATNGTYTNCHCTAKSSAGDAVCFDAKTDSLIRLIGGTYYSYVGNSANRVTVMNIGATETNGVIMAYNINCPTVYVSGFTQRHLAIANAGAVYISGACCTMESTGTKVTIVGQIWKSKR